MITVCFAVKGGSGTTVVVASMALTAPRPTLIVDLDGDLPAVLGVPEPDGPGLLDWARSTADAGKLSDLAIDITDGVSLLPRGQQGPVPPERWADAADWLHGRTSDVIVDAGTTPAPSPSLIAAADRTVLVTRPCYLAMRAAARLEHRPSGVIVIEEPGRALGTTEVVSVVGAPLVASILLDPAIARAVDAGLLLARLPRGLRRVLRPAA
jgi:hypothetical protein